MRAVAYARYSSDNQREESIDAQIRAINQYAQNNDIQIVTTYIDEAKSAKTDDRPSFTRMIKESALGLFDMIIVHKLDRFARNRYDSAFYKKKLKDNGVRIVSVLEHLDSSPESIMLESVLEGMAEYYSVNLAREVMKGMKETALQCKHAGGTPPLGYDVKADKTYEINLEESKTVKTIFKMYASGHSYNKIIDYLNNEGIKTKRGNIFGKNSLHDMLKNEKYNGVYVFNKSSSEVNGKRNSHLYKPDDKIIRIEGGMPQIIDDELWNQVQKKMDINRRGKSGNSAKRVYLLTGLIYCGKCEKAMTGNTRYAGRNKTLYQTYECSTRKRNHECDMKSISKDYIENIVMNHLYNTLFSPKGIENTIKSIRNSALIKNQEIEKDIKEYSVELSGIETKINNITNAIANGMFHSSMKNKLDELETRKSVLNMRLSEAKRESEVMTPSDEIIRAYLLKDSNIKNKSLEEQRLIIQTYVSKIIVNENTIVINTIVSFNGGGEGNRTPVRKPNS
ncbi:recombinase family protein [Clostridium cadaveris]|uniref:recombinase family protein n=1 Tax=Clostridium cadaveris TaxID=1529 RepID=UPI0015D4AB7F|nr:recombinase family protein [Clostridium cadaveris]